MGFRNLFPVKRVNGGLASRPSAFDREIFNEVDRLFGDFLSGRPLASSFAISSLDFVPKVDVTETENEIQIKADLPGVDEKDIHVEYLDGTLRFSGERKTKSEEKK